MSEVEVQQVFNSVTVSTPGPQGAAGTNGTNGTNGVDGDPASQMERINNGYSVISRHTILNNVVTFASGNLRGSGFWAPDNITISSIGISSAGGVPQVGSTDIRFCLYSYDPVTADTVLLGQTDNVNDTLTVINTHYIRPLQTPVPITKGQRYVAGLFAVGGANFNVPSTLLGGAISGSGTTSIPPFAATVTTGLDSPPANVVATSSTQSIFVAIYESVMTLEF